MNISVKDLLEVLKNYSPTDIITINGDISVQTSTLLFSSNNNIVTTAKPLQNSFPLKKPTTYSYDIPAHIIKNTEDIVRLRLQNNFPYANSIDEVRQTGKLFGKTPLRNYLRELLYKNSSSISSEEWNNIDNIMKSYLFKSPTR